MSTLSDSSAQDIAKAAKSAFNQSQLLDAEQRVKALHEISDALEAAKAEILAANQEDLKVGNLILH